MTTKTIKIKSGDNVLLTSEDRDLTVRTDRDKNGISRVRVIASGKATKEDPPSPPSGDPGSHPPQTTEANAGDPETSTPQAELAKIRAATEATSGVDESSAATAAAVKANTTVTEPTQASRRPSRRPQRRQAGKSSNSERTS